MGPAFVRSHFLDILRNYEYTRAKLDKMKAVGITAEYNPLHNGHVYHLQQARSITGADAVVIALSGNFVQRGMPAVSDKWTRTGHALRCGADLVIEIPVLQCLGNAGQYASASVRLLESLGVSHLAFGSESGDIDALMRTASFLKENSARLDEEIRSFGRHGYSYPDAREKAYIKLGGDDEGHRILNSPNDILAMEYILNMKEAVPTAVRRLGAGYGQSEDRTQQFQSATGIRQMIRDGRDISDHVPACVCYDLAGQRTAEIVRERDFRLFDMIRYAILTVSPEVIDDCPSGDEGLGNLVKSEARTAETLDQLIKQIKSRRYTYTRISRLLMQLLLGIDRTSFYSERGSICPGPAYIRILGFNDTGRELLSEVKNKGSSTLPVLTNINKERESLTMDAAAMLELDVHASDVFNLINGLNIFENSDQRKKPVYLR